MPTYVETSDGSCCCGGCACPDFEELFATFDCPGFACVDGISFTLDYLGEFEDLTPGSGGRIVRRWQSSIVPCDCDGPIVIECDTTSENPTFEGNCYRMSVCTVVSGFGTVVSISPLEITFNVPDTGFFGPCSLTVTE